MKSKRFLCLLLVLAAVFAFSGCGGSEDSSSGTGDTTSASDTTGDTGSSETGSDTTGGSESGSEEKIVLTEDTDFSALVSERLTEEEWRAAFDKEAYTNYTIKIVRKSGDVGYCKNDNGLVMINLLEGYLYYYFFADRIFTVYMSDSSGDSFMTLQEGDEGYDEIIKIYDEWINLYTSSCPDFGEFYAYFDYDETAGRYVYTGDGIRTNAVFEINEVDYLHAEVKILDGRIAYVRCCSGLNEDGTYVDDADIYFYDFGSTELTMPDLAETNE